MLYIFYWVSLVAQTGNLSAMQETQVWSLGWQDPLKKGIATHSSILARGIPWTVEPGSPQSLGSQTPSQLTESMHALGHLYKVRGSWRTWTSETFQCTNSNFPSHLSRSLSTPNRTLTLAYQTYLIGSSANLVVYPWTKSSVFSALPWKGWCTYKIKLQRLSGFCM